MVINPFIIVYFLEVTIKVMFTLPACGLMRLHLMIYPYKEYHLKSHRDFLLTGQWATALLDG